TTTVRGGSGNDQFFVGSSTDPAASTLDSIQGPLTVDGTLGADGQGDFNYLELRDRGSTTPHCYNLTGTATTTTLTRSPGAAPITSAHTAPPTVNPPGGLVIDYGPQACSPPMATDLALSNPVRAGQRATLSGRLVDPDAGDA